MKLYANYKLNYKLKRSAAFIWDSKKNTLNSINKIKSIKLKLLIGIERQKKTIFNNTLNFAKGNITNNALLWGARGNGKSTLIKSTFNEIIPVSALRSNGLEDLGETPLNYLPEGPQYFPENMSTNCTEEFLVEEIVREKIMQLTHMEIPYSVAVVVEGMQEGHGGVWVIDALGVVEKPSQKKILIGAKGAMLKKLGKPAREEIEKRFGCKV